MNITIETVYTIDKHYNDNFNCYFVRLLCNDNQIATAVYTEDFDGLTLEEFMHKLLDKYRINSVHYINSIENIQAIQTMLASKTYNNNLKEMVEL